VNPEADALARHGLDRAAAACRRLLEALARKPAGEPD
jgi:hypothetical protein